MEASAALVHSVPSLTSPLPISVSGFAPPTKPSSTFASSCRPIHSSISIRSSTSTSNAGCFLRFGASSSIHGDGAITLSHRVCWPLSIKPAPRRSQNFQICAVKKTFSSFDDMIQNSEVPVLVDFYATWCGPCQYMVPILHDVGNALKDKISIVKIDSDKYPNLAGRYEVHGLPTLLLFDHGKPIDRLALLYIIPELQRIAICCKTSRIARSGTSAICDPDRNFFLWKKD
ncbi:hypothetical protein O6H91_Y029400 [Diphasiastrum complanatum]|nr:hypothetical protein O6H91_Y029400 [Diphasiastrum complanatum]